MEARVDVNENDIIRVSLGDSAIVDVDAYSHTEHKFKGIVTQIANTANDKASADAVTEFEVRIRILNESYEKLLKERNVTKPFRPGMTANVDVVTEVKDNVLAVPLSAVTTRSREDEKEDDDSDEGNNQNANKDSDKNNDQEDDEVVFVVKEGKAVKTIVKTGVSDFDNIEVLEGVSEGDEIVTGPFEILTKRLKDGELVERDGDIDDSK